MLSSEQNTLDGTHSQHSTSQDDVAGVEEANQGFPAVQLADAQVSWPATARPSQPSPGGRERQQPSPAGTLALSDSLSRGVSA